MFFHNTTYVEFQSTCFLLTSFIKMTSASTVVPILISHTTASVGIVFMCSHNVFPNFQLFLLALSVLVSLYN
jgi:hypothetical protein